LEKVGKKEAWVTEEPADITICYWLSTVGHCMCVWRSIVAALCVCALRFVRWWRWCWEQMYVYQAASESVIKERWRDVRKSISLS